MIGADVPTMGTEIERKFLLRQPGHGPALVAGLAGTPLQQGYFTDIDGWSVRLRLAPGKAWLTLKSRDAAAMRWEIESPLDPARAAAALALLPPEQCLAKTRYRLPLDGGAPGLAWEIDSFSGRHAGLWLVEIELPRADYPLALPDWLGADVTDDPRYRNAALAAAPGGDSLALPADLDAMARQLLQTAPGAAMPVAKATVLPVPPPLRDRSAGRRAERALRKMRLERELRANLLRRKQQGRGREEAAPEPAPGLDRDDPAT